MSTGPATLPKTPPERPTDAAKQHSLPLLDQADNEILLMIPPMIGVILGSSVLVLLVLWLLLRPDGLMSLVSAFVGPHNAWYLSRASAFAAYGLLWLSMVWGLLLTNRLARLWPGGPTAADLHEYASVLGLGFAILHTLVLLGDSYIGYTLPQLLIPFAGESYRPMWVGVGQIGLYLMIPVTFTFYVRQWLGVQAWRAIHMASFLVFVLALAHGLFSGTDTNLPWVWWMYVGSAVCIAVLTLYQVYARSAQTGKPVLPMEQ